jgi:hypothetical protein
MKSDVREDFTLAKQLLDDLGFVRGYTGSTKVHIWECGRLRVSLSVIPHHIYDTESRTNIIKPHIKLTYTWMREWIDDDWTKGNTDIDVLITQDFESIRQSIISSSLTDLGIKVLNRNIKLYALFNNIDYKPSEEGSISCMALKLNPKLFTYTYKVI